VAYKSRLKNEVTNQKTESVKKGDKRIEMTIGKKYESEE